ncbi:hypothetical protein ACEZCY_35940 [Streptacidiphilus sp. N1-12]|uniref:Uncharacterized protein n=1 Tax=Streptacidiphilus alkalitolerans TaxID=3342712 RepID=A0ABV6WRB4_9ACTN
MDVLLLMAIAYAISGGIKAGSLTAQQRSKTELEKKPPTIDKTDTGKKAMAGLLNTVAKVYTFTSGAKEGWSKAWPETKTVISDRRTQVKDAKAARKDKAAKDAIDADAIIDAEIVEETEDEPVLNTKGPSAPDPEKVAEAAKASADATIHVTVTTDPPAPPPPPAEPRRRAEVWDDIYDDYDDDPPVPPMPPRPPDPPAPAPAPAPAGDGPRLRVVPDTTSTSAPGSSMPTNLPTASETVTEVEGVNSLMVYLAQLSSWATVEMDDAAAAVARLADLLAKAEHALAAATAAKYDKATLQQLAAIVERVAKLRDTREKDLASSELSARNAATAASNVWSRHGGVQEARDAAPVDMAETSTYGD